MKQLITRLEMLDNLIVQITKPPVTAQLRNQVWLITQDCEAVANDFETVAKDVKAIAGQVKELKADILKADAESRLELQRVYSKWDQMLDQVQADNAQIKEGLLRLKAKLDQS